MGSGCSALVYELVWFQLLQLVIGASAVSLGVLLASFMGGMCLGSLALPRLVSPRPHPLRVYALLELGIAACGLILLAALPQVRTLYVSAVGYGVAGIHLRAAICLLSLLPPTVLMGATLPALARWLRSTPEGVQRLGLLYGANIVGAVLGTLLAGFYLLRVHGLAAATWTAAAGNLLVALTALALVRIAPYQGGAADAPATSPVRTRGPSHLVLALSGFTALGAEVIWTRQLSLLLGATVYTFTILLAVFLTGLGLGSGLGAALATRVRRPGRALGWCQLLLVLAIPYGACMIVEVLPYWSPFHEYGAAGRLLRDLVRAGAALGPATLLWGASFPLGLAAAAAVGQDPGRLVGGMYAANTIGAIAGSLAFGLVATPLLGTRASQWVLVGVAAAASTLMLAPGRGRLAAAGPLVLAILMLPWVPPVPPGLIAYGRSVQAWDHEAEFLFLEEGSSASVAVSRYQGSRLDFHVSGKVVASTDELDLRVQRMLGHLPGVLHPDPRSVLVVGCGAGVTAGTFVRYPGIERIVLCEIEPRVLDGAREHFGPWNHEVLEDPRTVVIPDDARHYLTTTQETFDIITSDPIHPWVRGAATLYSSEYLALCRERLNPGGLITQWVPLYETSEPAVKSQIGTFMRAFPHGSVWNSSTLDEGHDVVLLGHDGRLRVDVAATQSRLDSLPGVRSSLAQVDLDTAVHLLGTFAGQAGDLDAWLVDAELNTDDGLRLQYLAGLALDARARHRIYDSLVGHRLYPDNLLEAGPDEEAALRDLILGP